MGVSPIPEPDRETLTRGVLALVGVGDHPRTVKVEILDAPNGRPVIAVMETTRGPLKVHMFKVTADGDILRLRNGR